MDKPKSKDDLRAAGKKRLEAFRQKKQQKGSSTKSSSASQDDIRSPSGSSSGPGRAITKDDNSVRDAAEDKSCDLAEMTEEIVRPKEQGRSSKDDRQQSATGRPTSAGKIHTDFENGLTRSSSHSEIAMDLVSPNQDGTRECQTSNGNKAECVSSLKDSSVRASGESLRVQSSIGDVCGENGLDTSGSHASDVQTFHEYRNCVGEPRVESQELRQPEVQSEGEALKRQLQNVVEENEQSSSHFVITAKQQCQENAKMKAFIAEMEAIQQELSCLKHEKVKLVEDFGSSQKELQNANQHLLSELMDSHRQVLDAKDGASRLSEDLELVKYEMAEKNAHFAFELKNLQQTISDGDLKRAKLSTELANGNKLVQRLLEEKASLMDEVDQVGHELRDLADGKERVSNELQESKMYVQALEESLALKQKILQQLQESDAEKSQLLQCGNKGAEQLEASLLAREQELEACRGQLHELEAERDRLVCDVGEFGNRLRLAKQKEDKLLCDLEMENMSSKEHSRIAKDAKAELSAELQKLKVLEEDRAGLQADFDLNVARLKGELKKMGEENTTQRYQLQEARQEAQKVVEQHAEDVKKMEFELSECRAEIECITGEKSNVFNDLQSVKEEIIVVTDEKGREVMHLADQLQECRDLVKMKVEENVSMVALHEDFRQKLEAAAQLTSDLTSELEMHRATSDGLMKETNVLESEVLKSQARLQCVRQAAEECNLELENVKEYSAALEMERSNLTNQLKIVADELVATRKEKTGLESEVVTYGEQVTMLKEQNSAWMRSGEESKTHLQRLTEENVRSLAELALELDKQRGLSSGLLEERGKVASELQEVVEKSQVLQQDLAQCQRVHISELEVRGNQFAELKADHTQLSDNFSVVRDELSTLRKQKDQDAQELVKYQRRLLELEGLNQELAGSLAKSKESLDASVAEKTKLLCDHVTELDKFNERQRVTEEASAQLVARIQQLLSDVQELKNEKHHMSSEIKASQGQQETMRAENLKLASEYNRRGDRFQQVVKEKESKESALRSELERSREHVQSVEECNAGLVTELEENRRCLRQVNEQNFIEVQKLQSRVQELIQLQERMARELTASKELAREMETGRNDLMAEMKGISEQLAPLSEERSLLLSNLEVSQRQVHELENEKMQLIDRFKTHEEKWQAENTQLSRSLQVSLGDHDVLSAEKARVDSELADLREADNAERAQLAVEVGALKDLMSSDEVQRADLVTKVEQKDKQLQALRDQYIQLERYLIAERENVTSVENELAVLSEDLRAAKLRREAVESELDRLMVDHTSSQTQVKFLTQEKIKAGEELARLGLDLKVLKDEKSQHSPKPRHGYLQIGEEASESAEDFPGSPASESNDAGIRLASCVRNLVREFESKARDSAQGGPGSEQHSPGFTTQVTELFSQLKLLRETSKRLKRELADAQITQDTLRVQLKTKEEHSRECIEENVHLTALIQELESKQQWAETASGQVAELQSQVMKLAEEAGSLKETKDRALEAESSAQSKLREADSNMERASDIENQLRVLEARAATLQMERDEFSLKLVGMQESNTQLSNLAEKHSQENISLQNEVLGFEAQLAEKNAELEIEKDQAFRSQHYMRSLIQILEAAISDAFPEVGQEIQVSQVDADSDAHCIAVASKLQTETAEIRHQLQNALEQIFRVRAQLSKAEEDLTSMEGERDIAVGASEDARLELKRVAEDRNGLEASLRRLVSLVRPEERNVATQLKGLSHLGQSESDQASGHSVQDTFLSTKPANLSSMEGEMKSIVSRLPGPVTEQQTSHDSVLLGRSGCHLLEEGIMSLLRKCENLERTVSLSSESYQSLAAENSKLNQSLQDMQEAFKSAELDLEALKTEQAAAISRQKSELEGLWAQIQKLNNQSEKEYTERTSLQLRLSEAEQKLSVTKEKLSLAVNKGKAAVQQRDAWKQSVAEKSGEHDQLVARHQQDLQEKNGALASAERKITELTVSVEQMGKAETELCSLRNLISSADQVFLEKHDLCVELNSSGMPENWHSSKLVDKILWISGGAAKLLQEVAARKEEVQTLTRNASMLTIAVEKLEARITTLTAKERSLEHDNGELASRLDDYNIHHELELQESAKEREDLSAIIRQKDLDIAGHRHDMEDLVKRMEESETEITAASRNATEQREQLSSSVESYQSLNATLQTLVQNLTDLFDAIPPIELDAMITELPPLLLCKHVIHRLIDNRNIMVVKLKGFLHQAPSEINPSAHGDVLQAAFQTLDARIALQDVPKELIEQLGEAFDTIEQQEIISQTCAQRCDKLARELAREENEKKMLHMEVAHREQKVASVQEELNTVVNECKSLVGDNCSLKQALVGKESELETLAAACREELHSKDEMWQAELHNSRIAEGHLSSELELATSRVINLSQQMNSLEEDKKELLRQLESSMEDYKVELQQMVIQKTELVSKIRILEENLAVQKQEKENLVDDHEELLHKHTDLNSKIAEIEADAATLRTETEVSDQRIAELEASLENVSLARTRLELDVDAVVARLQDCTEDPLVEGIVDSSTLIPQDSQFTSQLESLSVLLVVKCKAAGQKIQELSDEKALVADSQQRMMANASSDKQTVEELRQRLLSRDSEIREASKRMEEADLKVAKQADITQGLLQELQIVKKDLVQSKRERDAVQSELLLVEGRAAATREKLALAVKKGKGLAQQRDSLTQAHAAQNLAITNLKDELVAKQSELVKAENEVLVFQEEIRVLETKVSSMKKSESTLEQNLQNKNILMQKLEAVVAKCDFPKEWQSRDLLETVERLVATVADSRRNLIAAGKEAETLKRASDQLNSKLRIAQTKAAAEEEARAITSLKLDECEQNLMQSQTRIAELEGQTMEIGKLYQQTKMQSRQILNLEATLEERQVEVKRAEEVVTAWAERSKESEKYVHWSQERISELERKDQELVTARRETQLLHNKIAKVEEIAQRKETAIKALEVSRGIAVGKLTTTVSKFQELCQQSEGLVKQMERMHESLQEKDVEIIQLNEEVAKTRSQSQTLQENVDSKISFLSQLEGLLDSAILSGRDSRSPAKDEDVASLPSVSQPDEEVALANVNFLTNRLSGFIAQSQAWQADAERKDVQLQGLRMELLNVASEKSHLKENLQKEQVQIDRLKAEVAALQPLVRVRDTPEMEEIQEVPLGTRLLPLSSPAPHVRGGRKPASMDVAIDVDTDKTRLFTEIDDKGHGFKSLSSSRLMPRGTHALAGQVDRLCVAGGRVLMRKPAARLGLTLYWLAIHIWMIFLVTAAHV